MTEKDYDHKDKIISSVTDAEGAYFVGSDGVTEIREHQAQGEGDRWFYDVHYERGLVRRIFAPAQVLFSPDTPEEDIAF